MRVVKIFSVSLAVLVGLVPAFILVFGLGGLFSDVRVSAASGEPKTPQDPFIIGFSGPVEPKDVGSISITPDAGITPEWRDGGRKLVFAPAEGWTPDVNYQVVVGGTSSGFGRSIPASYFSFRIPGYPNIVSVTPEDGSKETLIGVEDPIVVRFDRSVEDFFIDFRISPGVSVVYEHDEEKTEFKLLPKEMVRPGTEYSLEVYAKWRGMPDSAYRLVGRKTSFTTMPDRPKSWSENLASRLEEAKRYARPLVAEGKYIDIDLSAQVMTTFEDGRLLGAFLISSGKRGMDTPKGEYSIRNKAARPWSKTYGLFMPHWMALTPDGKYGIHELPEWPGGYKEGANHLGTPVSHGCVRLGVGSAKQVWEWSEVGTRVVVH